jgi:hypothetical protein
MLNNLDWKLFLATTASLLTVFSYVPYFRDIFARKTKPHLYTWLIWTITQGTAAVALLYGGGKFGGMSLIIGTIFVLAIFILSFQYGSKNITRSDTISLIVAFIAIIIWWTLKNPLLSVLMITIIDGIGLIPTIRKSYLEPYSETISFWVTMAIIDILSIISNAQYNFLTITYLTMLAIGNVTVAVICLSRRKVLQNPNK